MKIISHLVALVGSVLLGGSTLTAATFTVTNADDSGPGSLRDALIQANSNGQEDTINFDGGFFGTPRTITLTSGELPITRDGTPGFTTGRLLTINGPGPDRLTISGNNVSRVFSATLYSNLVMSGLTVRDGNGVGLVLNAEGKSGGGMIAHNCFITLSNVVFRNNSVPDFGGAIYLSGIRSFTMTNSVVTENFAVRLGGGIYAPVAQGPVTLRGSTISKNSTDNEVGGVAIANGTTTIENCLITENKGGLKIGGSNGVGGLSLFQTGATVTDTTISNNTTGVPNSPAGGSDAGVSADASASAPMVFRRVTVKDNTAHTAAGGGGAGMYLRAGGGVVTVIDSTVSGNRAISHDRNNFQIFGGGIRTAGSGGTINLINTTIANNLSENAGGGIHNLSSDLRVINSTIVNNAASGLGSTSGPRGGGGIFNHQENGGVIRVQNTIIANNSGTTTGGLAPDIGGPFISNGYNLVGNTAGSSGFGAAGDQLNVNPLLSPGGLQNNGGATLTIALQPNSPAIDKGKTAAEVATDQRGVTRPTDNPGIPNADGGDGSDIGAFEIGAANGVAEKTLGNIATRLQVETGENVLIGGIIVVGDVPKRVIIRALGPSLGAQGVSGALEDPTLELFQGDTLLAANNNWRDDQQGEIADTGVAPSDDREAAIVRTLSPGSYTAVLRGNDNTTGVGLVEAYDLDQRPNSKLANISTRGFVGSGDNVLIGGFIVGPTTQVVVRAIGPSLGTAGVAGALQDTALEVVNANGEVIRANDNWKGTQRAELEAIGIQPSDDRESALIATLTAGNYTAVVRGVGVNTGVGLVEVYNLP